MELTASDLWSRILQVVQTGLPEQAFRTWLAGTKASGLSEVELLVEAPSQFHVEWLEDKYGPLLHDTARKIIGRPLAISFSPGVILRYNRQRISSASADVSFATI